MFYLLLYTCVAIGALCAIPIFLFLYKKTRRRRSFPGALLRLAICLGASFLVAELCVRLVWTTLLPKDRRPSSFDAELGWSRPPANRVLPDADLGSESESQPIVFVGDSVAFGHGVAPEQGMVHQTRLLLKNHGLSVLNAAVSGYGIDQTCLYVKRHLPAWDNLKTLVVVLFAGNDLTDTAANMRYGRSKPLLRHTNGKLHQSDAKLSRYSRRNLLSQSRLIFSFEALHPLFSDLVNELCGKAVISEEESRRVVQMLLSDLLQEMNKRHIETLLVLIPAKMDFITPGPSFDWLEATLRKGQGRLLNILHHLQSHGIEADSLFLRDDPWHLSIKGNQIVADFITETILDFQPPR